MRVIVQYVKQETPLLRFYIHGAPHRRIHQAILREYRKELWEAAQAAKLPTLPISTPVELSVTFIHPTSPDLDNLVTALFQALDGKTGKGPTILKDDRLIVYLKDIGLMFP